MTDKVTFKDEEGNQVERKTMTDVPDLKTNNKLLWAVVIIVSVWTVVGLWLIYKVISDNVLNNYIASCI